GRADAEHLARRHGREMAERPFDLENGPLFEPLLIRLAPDDHVLLLRVHHIVFDGWSEAVLFGELSELYEAHVERRAPALPPLAMRYGDHAAWQRDQIRGAVLDRLVAYWKRRLAGAPTVLDLPTDRPRPPVGRFHGAIARARLDGRLVVALEQLARREAAS